MKRFFIELSYNGRQYCGWQRQINAPSVEQSLEEGLTKILRNNVNVVGCGRTDTGVHASFYVAHFDLQDSVDIDFNDYFIYHLNAILPKDIAVQRIYQTELHARFDAKVRQYKYYICRHKDVFNPHVWYIGSDLDYDAMKVASEALLRYDDFTSFAKVGSDNKTNICRVNNVSWQVDDTGQAVFTISADRFLRGMVRGIVGTLVDVGRGKITVEQFEVILQAKNRSKASSQAPPNGLFLTDIRY